MTAAVAETSVRREALKEASERLRLLDVRDASAEDPKALINEIRYFDPVTQLWVEFRMFPPEDWVPPIEWLQDGEWKFTEAGADDWFWQRLIIDWLDDPEVHAYLILKARQLGITLLCCAYALWLMLYRPGTATAAYSYTEEEAFKLTVAVWEMFQSLPSVLTEHVEVVTPKRGALPTEWIRLRHSDGRMSSFQALPATKKHGHGARVYFGIMDEMARQDYAREIFTAILPATVSRGGKLIGVSTAFGVSNKETGAGNFFHHLYSTRVEKGISFRFLPWSMEPTRDEEWYERVAMKLDEVERNQQYPLNELDAFMLSGALYFNRESLAYYRSEVIEPSFRGQFVLSGRRKARLMKLRDGIIEVYERPVPDGRYALTADVSSGRAEDYTSMDVIDLSSGAIVAHLHGKLEVGRAAIQAHFLGKWYNNAKICVERAGGWGEALITALRDGTDSIPPYGNLYRHTAFTRGNRPISEEYGYPMNKGTRGQVLDGLKLWLRQRQFPWMTSGHMDELGTFIYTDTTPSPRADEGCNDDRVISLALAVEMFRQFGQRPEKKRKWRKHKYTPSPVRTEH